MFVIFIVVPVVVLYWYSNVVIFIPWWYIRCRLLLLVACSWLLLLFTDLHCLPHFLMIQFSSTFSLPLRWRTFFHSFTPRSFWCPMYFLLFLFVRSVILYCVVHDYLLLFVHAVILLLLPFVTVFFTATMWLMIFWHSPQHYFLIRFISRYLFHTFVTFYSLTCYCWCNWLFIRTFSHTFIYLMTIRCYSWWLLFILVFYGDIWYYVVPMQWCIFCSPRFVVDVIRCHYLHCLFYCYIALMTRDTHWWWWPIRYTVKLLFDITHSSYILFVFYISFYHLTSTSRHSISMRYDIRWSRIPWFTTIYYIFTTLWYILWYSVDLTIRLMMNSCYFLDDCIFLLHSVTFFFAYYDPDDAICVVDVHEFHPGHLPLSCRPVYFYSDGYTTCDLLFHSVSVIQCTLRFCSFRIVRLVLRSVTFMLPLLISLRTFTVLFCSDPRFVTRLARPILPTSRDSFILVWPFSTFYVTPMRAFLGTHRSLSHVDVHFRSGVLAARSPAIFTRCSARFPHRICSVVRFCLPRLSRFLRHACLLRLRLPLHYAFSCSSSVFYAFDVVITLAVSIDPHYSIHDWHSPLLSPPTIIIDNDSIIPLVIGWPIILFIFDVVVCVFIPGITMTLQWRPWRIIRGASGDGWWRRILMQLVMLCDIDSGPVTAKWWHSYYYSVGWAWRSLHSTWPIRYCLTVRG